MGAAPSAIARNPPGHPALCSGRIILLGYGIPTWLSDSRFNFVFFVGLAVVTSLVGLPPMIWQRNRRRRVQ